MRTLHQEYVHDAPTCIDPSSRPILNSVSIPRRGRSRHRPSAEPGLPTFTPPGDKLYAVSRSWPAQIGHDGVRSDDRRVQRVHQTAYEELVAAHRLWVVRPGADRPESRVHRVRVHMRMARGGVRGEARRAASGKCQLVFYFSHYRR